jgi:hypothetical protein
MLTMPNPCAQLIRWKPSRPAQEMVISRFGDTGKSGSGGPLSDHLGLDALDAAIGVADGAIAEAGFLEAWLDYVIEMGSANVEDAWLAWLVVKVARSVNLEHHVSATVRRGRLRPCADHGCFGSVTRQRLNKYFRRVGCGGQSRRRFDPRNNSLTRVWSRELGCGSSRCRLCIIAQPLIPSIQALMHPSVRSAPLCSIKYAIK